MSTRALRRSIFWPDRQRQRGPSIVETAASQFTQKGYRNTKMADIAAESGVGPLTLYRFYSAKRELFIQVVDVLVERALKHTESLILPESDEVKRHLLRVRGFLDVRDISREMLTFVRAEALFADAEVRRFFVGTYELLTRALVADLRLLRKSHAAPVRSSDEMMGYALLGIMEESAMRLSFDESTRSRTTYGQTSRPIFLSALSIEAGLTGSTRRVRTAG